MASYASFPDCGSYDGVTATIFKDGRQKGIKLPILNVRVSVLDTSDISLTKSAHWICSPFWYSYSVWVMDYISECINGIKAKFERETETKGC